MSDRAAEILRQHAASGGAEGVSSAATSAGPPQLVEKEDFDESAYLWRYPDVQDGVASGLIESAYSHFLHYGRLEGRRAGRRGEKFGERFARSQPRRAIAQAPVGNVAHACDRLIISSKGGLLLIGWADDQAATIRHIQLSSEYWTATFEGRTLIRTRRVDVEKEIDATSAYHYGYTTLLYVNETVPRCANIRIILTLMNGQILETETTPSFVSDIDLRDTALSHLSAMAFFGNPQVELISALGAGVGDEIVKLNCCVTKEVTARPLVLRYGEKRRPPKASLIVCLYGKAEFIFLQNALFSRCEGIEDYELVFVCNSPELAEIVARDAEICAGIYGIPQTVVLLAGNAGFGGANNVATQAAASKRLIVMNPDVFPYDLDWAKKHTALIESGSPQEVKLFGVPLYYNDGSLMHGGMYFDVDNAVASRDGAFMERNLVRVEHYGKGAPTWAADFVRPRPVPAVTGAFMSVDRAWFESLGGFTEDFVFGHYEDADLCLKSLAEGRPRGCTTSSFGISRAKARCASRCMKAAPSSIDGYSTRDGRLRLRTVFWAPSQATERSRAVKARGGKMAQAQRIGS